MKSKNPGEKNMRWTTPEFEEIMLACEINSYVSGGM
jgi:coenzyme PQQ precursor peptide PqqA